MLPTRLKERGQREQHTIHSCTRATWTALGGAAMGHHLLGRPLTRGQRQLLGSVLLLDLNAVVTVKSPQAVH